MTKYGVVALVLCVWLGPVLACDVRDIELMDRATIRGRIVLPKNGTHRIRLGSMDELTISACDGPGSYLDYRPGTRSLSLASGVGGTIPF